MRVVAFVTTLDDAIVNVTRSATPELITRSRANAGRIQSRGVELEASWRVRPDFALRGSFVATDARFASVPSEPALENLRVPQVPRWQGAVGVDATRQQLGATLSVRLTGAQFDDDRNRFLLERATVVDGSAWWRVHPRVRVVGAVENLWDAEYDVGRTPLRTVGAPRLTRIGLRVEW